MGLYTRLYSTGSGLRAMHNPMRRLESAPVARPTPVVVLGVVVVDFVGIAVDGAHVGGGLLHS